MVSPCYKDLFNKLYCGDSMPAISSFRRHKGLTQVVK